MCVAVSERLLGPECVVPWAGGRRLLQQQGAQQQTREATARPGKKDTQPFIIYLIFMMCRLVVGVRLICVCRVLVLGCV